ncbi:DUF1735 domain-containing protein [Chitinophaga sp.]|uniref:BT_3987 domain-containing protein n=1 Tax=Chitinophaga sp. TaxID=1869181 RepID=UPI0031D3E92B
MKNINLKASSKVRPAISLLSLFLLSLGLSGCFKDDDYSLSTEGNIYMPQAYENRALVTMYDVDSAQAINFGAAYGGVKYPSSDIEATFEIDTTLIATYNTSNSTTYIALPADAYTISGLSATIKAGKTSSDALSISVSPKKLTAGTAYMLPIRLTNVSSGYLDSSLNIAYFRIDSLVQRARDITGKGTLTVSNDNSSGASASEGSLKVVDDDTSTKFYTGSYSTSSNFWLQLQFPDAQEVNQYTLTSGNDSPTRDPKTWELLGSNDGAAWDVVDEQNNFAFSDRTETVTFKVASPGSYSYYRIHITANNGATSFQLSEWRVIQFY